MEKQETIVDIIAEIRFHGQQNIDAEKDKPEYGILTVEGRIAQNYADRLEAAWKRERVLAVSIMRSKLYGIAGGLRAITARSDARQRGIHYTEVQNIAAQIENIADNGGEA